MMNRTATTTTTMMAPTGEDWSWVHPLASAQGGELLSDARTRALVRVMRDPDAREEQRTAARNELVTANLRLVISLAKRQLARGLPFEDLVQEGTLGLMRACETYDPDQARFSTYATWWILQALNHAINNQARLVRLPAWLEEQAAILMQEERRLTQALGRAATLDELTDALASRVETSGRWTAGRNGRKPVTEERVTLLLSARQAVVSLDQPAPRGRHSGRHAQEEHGRETLGDQLEGPEAAEALDEREELADAQWILDIARYALRQHYTHANSDSTRAYEIFVVRALEPDVSLNDLAERFHLSRERVRQIALVANEVVRKALLDCGMAPLTIRRAQTTAPAVDRERKAQAN